MTEEKMLTGYSYEVPDYFEVLDAFPVTNVGKIDYKKLEELNG